MFLQSTDLHGVYSLVPAYGMVQQLETLSISIHGTGDVTKLRCQDLVHNYEWQLCMYVKYL